MLLQLTNVHAGYGASQVLFGVSLELQVGQVATLMGRNGMGKTTTVRTIMGQICPTDGRISFKGRTVDRLPSYRIAGLGIGYVPEARRIFSNLTVRENLLMAERSKGTSGWTLDRVCSLFPRLAERLSNGGTQLSGGEQQMLAIGRALMTNPELLILDEATEGLAPVIRDEIWERLKSLKNSGLAILVIDKDLEALLDLADRHYVLEKGEIVWHGDGVKLRDDKSQLEQLVGI